MDNIVNLLEKQIIYTKKNRSSSYDIYLKNIDYKNIYSQFSTGGFAIENNLRRIFNFLFSRLIYKFKIFKSYSYKKIHIINKKLNVSLNINMIWHLIIFQFLKEKIYPKTICIIGDGKGNAVFNSYINFPNVKIFSVNLTEVLINDYLIIKKSKILNKKKIAVVSKINQSINPSKKLILIPANLKKVISRFKIDLFISIDSFSEMSLVEKKKYLQIISKQKGSFFYFNERNKKILIGGEVNLFNDCFPNKYITIMHNDATFMNFYYNGKFPFIHSRNKNKQMKHALVKII